LLQAHPDLEEEAETLAREILAPPEVEVLAKEVEEVLLALDQFELSNRAGSTRRGYVEPTEAAWMILGENVASFREQLKNLVEMGNAEGAILFCEGYLEGLYRCESASGSDLLLEWASDFPREEANSAINSLSQGPQLPESWLKKWPDWSTWLERLREKQATR
jgi:hypothetical protein